MGERDGKHVIDLIDYLTLADSNNPARGQRQRNIRTNSETRNRKGRKNKRSRNRGEKKAAATQATERRTTTSTTHRYHSERHMKKEYTQQGEMLLAVRSELQ